MPVHFVASQHAKPYMPSQAISAAMPLLRETVPASIEVGAYGNGFRQTTSSWLSSDGASSSSIIEPAAGIRIWLLTMVSGMLHAVYYKRVNHHGLSPPQRITTVAASYCRRRTCSMHSAGSPLAQQSLVAAVPSALSTSSCWHRHSVQLKRPADPFRWGPV